MKRLLLILTAVILAASSCSNVDPMEEKKNLQIDPTSISFGTEGGNQSLTLTTDAGSWTLTQPEGSEWIKPARTSGKTSTTINIKVEANEGPARNADIVFSAPNCDDVKVKVSQEAYVFSPTMVAEGLSIVPELPDADQEAVLYFKAGASSALYGYTGEVYIHPGVLVDGEWMYVPAEWDTNLPKCKMKSEGKNVWSLTFAPSIREWFASGTTPVKQIGIVVRSSDGTKKGIESDTFFSVTDNKYKEEVFNPDPVVEEALPAGMEYGINIASDNSVTFVLAEENKKGEHHDYCYIVGDFNDWERNAASAMKRDNDKGVWWITLDGFDPDKEYRFQYRIGTGSGPDLYLSDPYTEIVYDQWNDKYIPASTYPDLPAFPEKAKALVSAFKINKDVYNWQHDDFRIKDKDNLVIYELLFRDFSTTKDIKGVMDRLDYIADLGVNAIEVMPVQEFDGNLSWGYNPNHYFALDKAYGTRQMYKEFVDECHRRGIAVIVDVVYNHLTGISTYAKLYYSGDKTTADNPWFNVDAPHPFSVFHDINHENAMISDHIKKSLKYLLEEYDIDGFRFDLTKGFTQKKSNESTASNYDASRIAILKSYYNHIMSVNTNAVMILEHFCEEREERELAQYGMQIWRNCNHAYRTSVHGGAGDFSSLWTGGSADWTDKNSSNDNANGKVSFGAYVGYMESHDEERTCYGAVSDAGSVNWGICGTMTGWASGADIAMVADGPFYAAKSVTCTATDRFKIRGNGEWNDAYNYGASAENFKLTVGKEYVMAKGADSKDMYVPAAGTYDIYFCPDLKTIWLMAEGKRPEEPQVEVSDEDPLEIAMRRAGLNAAFFFTVPGPKMIWQFGEIGYDYSIEYNDRTGEKPVVTDTYMANEFRKGLYDTYCGLIDFRNENPEFFTEGVDFKWGDIVSTSFEGDRFIKSVASGKTFIVVGNFDTVTRKMDYDLPSGTWKNWFDASETYSGSFDPELAQGEFRLLVNF